MVTVGLIGGIASGKSAVAKEFERLGAVILDGDVAGHEVLTQRPVIDRLVERWGNQILQSDSPVPTIDRKKVAQIVFAQEPSEATVADSVEVQDHEQTVLGDERSTPQNAIDRPTPANLELSFLESVTHPAIGEVLKQQIAKYQQAGKSIIVLDAAVMVKAGWNTICDRIIFVDVPREIREQRAIKRGMSAEQFASRELAQTPVHVKKSLADFVIDNSGPLQKTYKQVEEVWHLLAQMA